MMQKSIRENFKILFLHIKCINYCHRKEMSYKNIFILIWIDLNVLENFFLNIIKGILFNFY